jgi:hypothetical protein
MPRQLPRTVFPHLVHLSVGGVHSNAPITSVTRTGLMT